MAAKLLRKENAPIYKQVSLVGRLMRIATLKSAYNSLLLALGVGDMKATYGKSRAESLFMWSDLTLGPLFKIKRE